MNWRTPPSKSAGHEIGRFHAKKRIEEGGRDRAGSDSVLLLRAKWQALARNAETPTTDPKELDAKVLIAEQAFDLELSFTDIVIAAANVSHIGLFGSAGLWTNIRPFTKETH